MRGLQPRDPGSHNLALPLQRSEVSVLEVPHPLTIMVQQSNVPSSLSEYTHSNADKSSRGALEESYSTTPGFQQELAYRFS